MGEQGGFTPPNHIYTVIMRNSRGKVFVYVAVFGVLCFVVFLLSSTHTSLKELEGVNEKCQQQRDSLSAQLQVVYEHKNRLEKSLQQEKTDHKHTKEVNEKQVHETEMKLQQEKDKRQQLENQITQLKTSYSELEEDKTQAENALKEQLHSVQTQKNGEIEKLQAQISDLLAEKDKLEMSKNAFAWKIEQHASEVNLCHLQQQQLRVELGTCQEQLQKRFQSTVGVSLFKSENTQQKVNAAKKVTAVPTQPHLPVDNNHVDDKKTDANITASSLPKIKSNVLEKPNVLPMANGDGVLPQPLDDINKLPDAAESKELQNALKQDHENKPNGIEDTDIHKKDIQRNGDQQEESKQGTTKKTNNIDFKDQENHPQVQAPNFDHIIDKDDHAGERGEYAMNPLPQYMGHEIKQQLEQPLYRDFHNDKHKNVVPAPRQINNDLAAAQMQDMMNKSPGNVNERAMSPLNFPPPHYKDVLENKIEEFRNADMILNRENGRHHGLNDKHYEEEDDDRENDDEPMNVPGQGLKAFVDNDFEDQENQDNAKEEEGVVVAPK